MAKQTYTCKVNGRTYEIPDTWLLGYCQAHKCDVVQAVEWWDYQARLAEDYEGE